MVRRRGEVERYDLTDVVEALQRAADEFGEPLSQRQYNDWAKEPGRPQKDAIARAAGGWSAACDEANIKPAGNSWTRKDYIESLRRCVEDTGHLTTTAYKEWSEGRNVPQLSSFYGVFESWQAAKDAVLDASDEG